MEENKINPESIIEEVRSSVDAYANAVFGAPEELWNNTSNIRTVDSNPLVTTDGNNSFRAGVDIANLNASSEKEILYERSLNEVREFIETHTPPKESIKNSKPSRKYAIWDTKPLKEEEMVTSVTINTSFYDSQLKSSIESKKRGGYVVTKKSIINWIGQSAYNEIISSEVDDIFTSKKEEKIDDKIYETEDVFINYNELADTLTQNYLRNKYGDFNLIEQKDEYLKILDENVKIVLNHKKEI